MNKLTFHALLRVCGLEPSDVRLVRHGNTELKAFGPDPAKLQRALKGEKDNFVLREFHEDKDRLTEYTAWQPPNKFGSAKFLAIFSPARGTTSLFLGIWQLSGETKNSDLTLKHQALLKKHRLPMTWFENSVRYHLQQTELMNELSERLVIEWGHATRNWAQWRDKTVVEIKPVNSIGEFTSYDRVLLSFADLRRLIKDKDSNVSWFNALSSVNGVYLIQHKLDGRLYVGAAYGKGGILGRWEAYANTGHAGNKLLRELDAHHFEFSVLEIAPSTMSQDDVTARETRWKECLGTRAFGLNEN